MEPLSKRIKTNRSSNNTNEAANSTITLTPATGVPWLKMANASKPLDKAANLAKPIAPITEVTREDIADVFIRFPDWEKDHILKLINRGKGIKRLAKFDLQEYIDIKPGVQTTYSKHKLLGYLVASGGTKHGVRCTTCRTGYGPFANGSCRFVQIPGDNITNGACGADIWGNERAKCDHSGAYNKAAHDSQVAHIETKRRIDGYVNDPNIDAVDIAGGTINNEPIAPRGYRTVGELFAPEDIDDNNLEQILWEAYRDLRYRRETETS